MHDDSTAILRAYTEEAVSKSCRNKGSNIPNKKIENGEKRKDPSSVEVDENEGEDMSRVDAYNNKILWTDGSKKINGKVYNTKALKTMRQNKSINGII